MSCARFCWWQHTVGEGETVSSVNSQSSSSLLVNVLGPCWKQGDDPQSSPCLQPQQFVEYEWKLLGWRHHNWTCLSKITSSWVNDRITLAIAICTYQYEQFHVDQSNDVHFQYRILQYVPHAWATASWWLPKSHRNHQSFAWVPSRFISNKNTRP